MFKLKKRHWSALLATVASVGFAGCDYQSRATNSDEISSPSNSGGNQSPNVGESVRPPNAPIACVQGNFKTKYPNGCIQKGQIDEVDVLAALQKLRIDLVQCYSAQQISKNAKPSILVKMKVERRGQVTFSGVEQSSLNNQEVESCFAKTVHSLKLKPLKSGDEILLTYKFLLPLEDSLLGSGNRLKTEWPSYAKDKCD
jgi:hypothetical protein